MEPILLSDFLTGPLDETGWTDIALIGPGTISEGLSHFYINAPALETWRTHRLVPLLMPRSYCSPTSDVSSALTLKWSRQISSEYFIAGRSMS